MRLKIEITRRLFSDARENRTGDQTAVIQFRFSRMRVVQHDQTDKFGMIGRQIASERNDVSALIVAAMRIDFFAQCRFCRR